MKQEKSPSRMSRGISRRNLIKGGGAVLVGMVLGGSVLSRVDWESELAYYSDLCQNRVAKLVKPPGARGTLLTGGAFSPVHAASGASGAAQSASIPTTPTKDMFIYYNYGVPSAVLAPGKGQLVIDGAVDHELSLNYSDLQGMPHETHVLTLECFVNGPGGSLIGNLEFEGVPMTHLMQVAGVSSQAQSVQVETADPHSPFALPLAGEIDQPNTLLVSQINGEPVSPERGGPYSRIMIPGAGGNHLPKWVQHITFSDQTATAHPAHVDAGFLSPQPPSAVVSRPNVQLSGYGFSGPEYVDTIEISTDNGQNYETIPFPAQSTPSVWTYWTVDWMPPQAGYYVLWVRATNKSGTKQEVPGVLFLEVR
jgi:DMSO/TMAO reductase YedYZ molybdopterin-dependent catalytic subunit